MEQRGVNIAQPVATSISDSRIQLSLRWRGFNIPFLSPLNHTYIWKFVHIHILLLACKYYAGTGFSHSS